MTSRIAAAVLALVTVLLAVMAVPLGILTSAQDRRDFRDDTMSAAATLASVAEERIGDGAVGPALSRSVRELARHGDRVAVYGRQGQPLAGTGQAPLTGAPLAGALRAQVRREYPAPGRLTVAVPVRADSGAGPIGLVLLSRPDQALRHRIVELWLLIAGVSVAGLLAAAVITMALARWAARPLTTLAAAARQLGSGELGTRAPAGSGPPEVRRLAGDFNTMAGRLQSLVRGQQTMLADVSHQVRTPLAALRLRLDLLAQDGDEHVAAELAGAQEEIARLTRLVNGLLAVARAESIMAAPARVLADAVIADRAAAWRPAAEERGVTLIAPGTGPVSIMLSPGHLEQILDNLIANALDALPPGGTIRVAIVRQSGRARITVADNGRGMTAGQRRAAFRRFSTGTPGGTGLGLAIVGRLVAANRGSVTLEDSPGGGLTVITEFLLEPDRPHSRRPAASLSGGADLNQS